MKNTNNTEKTDKLFAEITLNGAHLELINNTIEDIYEQNENLSDCNQAELDYLYAEKKETENRIQDLKKQYKEMIFNDINTCTGKIEIEYKDLPDEIRFQIYRFLNKISFDYPAEFGYRTIENEIRYSKDFTYDEKKNNDRK